MGTMILAVVVAGTVGAFTDWLFMGVLFHDAYDRYPEVWREGMRGGKSRNAIIAASVLGYGMTAATAVLCVVAHANTIASGLTVGLLTWAAGPLGVIVINNMFVKIDPRITVAHCAGYAARLALAGAAAGWALARGSV